MKIAEISLFHMARALQRLTGKKDDLPVEGQPEETQEEAFPPPMLHDPAALPLEELLKTLQVDPSHGLSSRQVKQRLQRYGANDLSEKERVSSLKRFLSEFKEPLSLLHFPAIAFSAVLGEILDAIGIAIGLTLNATIGFVQETTADRCMKALLSLSVREARVMRDGKAETIPARDLVPGDLILLKQGEIVPADARLIHSADLQTDESSLTGESAPVAKDSSAVVQEDAALHEKKNMVFSGTGVRNGTARAVVTATGNQTEIGEIARSLERAKPSPTPLEKNLSTVSNHFVRLGVASSIVIGLATALALGSPLAAVTTAIATLVAVIPESLPTVTTLILARGALKARENNVLVRKLSSVETLGSTSVIATDKTGTLTTGEMEGKKIFPFPPGNERWLLLGALLGNTAEREEKKWGGNPTETAVMKFFETLPGLEIKQVAHRSVEGNVRVTVQFPDQVTQDFSLTGKEFARIGKLIDEKKTVEAVTEMAAAVREQARDYPFSSERKMHTMAFPASIIGESGYISFTSGALERILDRTTLNEEERHRIQKENDRLAEKGYRVVALAHKRVDSLGETGEMEKELTFSGLMAIQDPLRQGVKESVSELHRAGIKVLIMTGDQSLTAAAIAQEAGILDSHRKRFVLSDDLLQGINYHTPEGKKSLEQIVRQAEEAEEIMISGKWIDLFKEDGSVTPDPKVLGILPSTDLEKLMPKVRLLYRVEPRHKLRMVQTLQDSGEVVAMTGDGVNDAPAIKKADIGIAMGMRGTNVAKEAAKMILTDDSFNSIACGVKTGRTIDANIRKFVSYILSSNLAKIVAVGLSSFAALALQKALSPIFTPLQLLWLEVAGNTPPALALGGEEPGKGIMESAPRPEEEGLITRKKLAELAITAGFMGAVAAGLYLLLPAIGVAATVAKAISFNYLVISQLLNALNARAEGKESPLKGIGSNKWLLASILGGIATQILLPFIPGIGQALRAAPLTPRQWALVGGLAAAVLPVGHLARWLFAPGAQANQATPEPRREKSCEPALQHG